MLPCCWHRAFRGSSGSCWEAVTFALDAQWQPEVRIYCQRDTVLSYKNNNNNNPKPHKKTLCCVIEHKIPLTVLGIPCGSVMCGCQMLACDAGLHCGSQNCWIGSGSVGLCLNEELSFKWNTLSLQILGSFCFPHVGAIWQGKSFFINKSALTFQLYSSFLLQVFTLYWNQSSISHPPNMYCI